jgi:uncharacterized membrane protein YfcA
LDFAPLVLAAFFAGFVDAVAGGGGLIQVPALLSVLPETPVATLFGTNKLSSIFGTGSAAWRYSRRISIAWRVVTPIAITAFMFSIVGAAFVAWVPVELVRPVVFVLLLLVVTYVMRQPDFGLMSPAYIHPSRLRSLFVGGGLGFYDGFFGPGTGSFLLFCFVRFFGMGFLEASGSAKVVNLFTNAAALVYFLPSGNVLLALALLMAIANVLGAQLGAQAALRGGNIWVRRAFLGISIALILRVGMDLV